jgi:hypothetical protein
VNGARFLAALALPALLLCFAQDGVPKPDLPLSGDFYLERSEDGFRLRSHGIHERTPSVAKFYPVPQSDVEMYRRLRPEHLKSSLPPVLTAREYQHQEVIGPYQMEGERIWFGNQYYDSEGQHGVGAFGYFDMQTRRYELFRPKEIARWEATWTILSKTFPLIPEGYFAGIGAISTFAAMNWSSWSATCGATHMTPQRSS